MEKLPWFPSQDIFEDKRSEIDSAVSISAKNGQEFNLIRTKVVPVEVKGVKKTTLLGYEIDYFIEDKTGVVFANINVRNNMNNNVEIIYYNNNSSLNGQGLITAGLSRAVKDLFKGQILDGYPGERGPLKIDSIIMEIRRTNISSQKVATRNGFVYDSVSEYATLLKEDYLAAQVL